jgi:hypothetical protein
LDSFRYEFTIFLSLVLLSAHIHDLVELIKKFADESYIQSLLEGEYDFGNGVCVTGEVGARFALSQVIFLLICKHFSQCKINTF